MNSNSKVSPTVIDLLFRMMKQRYGSKWQIGLVDKDNRMRAKLIWLDRLQKYTAGNVQKAMTKARVMYPERPPTLNEFDDLCNAQKPRRNKQPAYQWLSHEKVERATRATRDAQMKKIKETLQG